MSWRKTRFAFFCEKKNGASNDVQGEVLLMQKIDLKIEADFQLYLVLAIIVDNIKRRSNDITSQCTIPITAKDIEMKLSFLSETCNFTYRLISETKGHIRTPILLSVNVSETTAVGKFTPARKSFPFAQTLR